MNRDELTAKLTEALQALFELDPAQVTESSKLYDDLDIDSIDTVDLLLHLKQETGDEADFQVEQFRDVQTVSDLLDVLESLS